MFNLVLVEAGFREDTVIHRMNVITGDYLPPLRLQKERNFVSQGLEIIEVLNRDKPDKIIFDKNYTTGVLLYDVFTYLVTEDENLDVDSFGLITYKGD